jgi:hypothetical protein
MSPVKKNSKKKTSTNMLAFASMLKSPSETPLKSENKARATSHSFMMTSNAEELALKQKIN